MWFRDFIAAAPPTYLSNAAGNTTTVGNTTLAGNSTDEGIMGCGRWLDSILVGHGGNNSNSHSLPPPYDPDVCLEMCLSHGLYSVTGSNCTAFTSYDREYDNCVLTEAPTDTVKPQDRENTPVCGDGVCSPGVNSSASFGFESDLECDFQPSRSSRRTKSVGQKRHKHHLHYGLPRHD